jgi:hypothetical protein
MIPWYAPTSFKDHLRRLLALRSALVLSVILMLVVTEFRFGWIEKIIGAYLVSTNELRPESGTVWDQDHQTALARKTLSQFTHERNGVQNEAQRATSIGQVLAGIDREQGAMISVDHFVSLYRQLPGVLAHELISPYTLLTHLSANRWKRTFFERQGSEQLQIYLLDDHNQVLHRLTVGPVLIEHIQRGEVAVHTSLDQLEDFAAQIFPAEQFFRALNTLSEDVKKGVLDSPGNLLEVSGRIVRVGISRQAMWGAVDIGFEVEDVQGTKVILFQGREADVQRLLWILEESSAPSRPKQEGDRP